MSFAEAVLDHNNETVTENGMPALKSTLDACVDLFSKVAAMRTQSESAIETLFLAAYAENPSIALRIVAYTRDAREGSGERRVLEIVLRALETLGDLDAAKRLVSRAPELGRWDDVLVFRTKEMKEHAYTMIARALASEDRLCAKWMPREKNASKERSKIARELATFMGLKPAEYRRLLSHLSKVVETQMCAKEWSEINYEHVPSLASARYRKAYTKHDGDRYREYLGAVTRGEKKINASAIFPHDVIKPVVESLRTWSKTMDQTVARSTIAQWEAMPNWIGDASILPIVDTSGSMEVKVSGSTTAMQIAVAMGLYFAEKNQGPFRDVYMSFSSRPTLKVLSGTVVDRLCYMWNNSDWGSSTNLEAALRLVLDTAIKYKVAAKDMPRTLLILSDMQFNACVYEPSSGAYSAIRSMWARAGYEAPNVVFWNLRDAGNSPVKYSQGGAALLAGYSPATIKSVLSNKTFTPREIMLDTVMVDRYKV